mmetsp:Transcript_33679/g.49680  ORF Transcript_33679/g.49680 Transcript_33679/m.49680 type:complete len:125 (+) Transcript_33679:296-670(+)
MQRETKGSIEVLITKMTKNHQSERRRRGIVTVIVIVRITAVTTIREVTKERSTVRRVANMTAKKHSRRYDSDSYDSDDDRKKSSKHKKRKEKKRRRTSDDGSNSGDSYRLSSFFNKDSGDESDK